LWYDMISFLFPVYCPVCGIPMSVRNQVLCLSCENKMPRTGYAGDPDNPVAMLFWGRTRVELATSHFRFEKGSKYQKLLHLLKYKGDQEMGVFLGRLLGGDLKESEFARCDCLIPVPLHRKKERTRGYNQSEIIARGVSQATGIPVRTDILFRDHFTSTQTRKSRFERFQNVEHVFRVDGEKIPAVGLRILLIDDVVTTGSTLEACVEKLLQHPHVLVYIATVACA